MFEYFPTNYPWSLAVLMTLAQGGQISEIDDACRPLVEHVGDGEAWTESWLRVAQRVERQGRADEAAGHALSAAAKLKRAAAYTIIAERILPVRDPRHGGLYRHALDTFRDAVELAGERTTFVTLDTGHGPVAAVYCAAEASTPAPAIITVNGLDAYKEYFYLGGLRDDALARGLSVLLVDQPGVGETLRFNGIGHKHDVEVTVGAAIDWLAQQPEVDPHRIGLIGPSLGGYYGVRAAAREPRLAATALYGAIWDFGAKVRQHVEGTPAEATSVPEFVDSIMWFFQVDTVADLLEATKRFAVRDLAAEVTGPLLIVHGENDRQVPVEDARKVHAAAVNSRDLELRVFTRDEGSCEHCGIDNPSLQTHYIVDWLAERLRRSETSP